VLVSTKFVSNMEVIRRGKRFVLCLSIPRVARPLRIFCVKVLMTSLIVATTRVNLRGRKRWRVDISVSRTDLESKNAKGVTSFSNTNTITVLIRQL
jgi:hypothetical protein